MSVFTSVSVGWAREKEMKWEKTRDSMHPVHEHILRWCQKTRNLLQISKCDKEIQLIRIRCRHEVAPKLCFVQFSFIHSHLLANISTVWTRRQLKLNHMLCWRVGGRNRKNLSSEKRNENKLFFPMLHKNFTKTIRWWWSENRKIFEVFFSLLSISFWGHNY